MRKLIVAVCFFSAVFVTHSAWGEGDMEKVRSLFQKGKYEKGLEIVHQHQADMERLDREGLRWLELFIQGSEEILDVPQLVVLFEFFPEIFKQHERAALLVANAYIVQNQIKEFKKVRSLWQDRETKVANWFVLDVDALLQEGKKTEAITLLKSRSFNDKADVDRLIRLALIHVKDQPQTAWKYLGEAYAKAPKDADIRSYKARLLESVGKIGQAEKEHQEAIRLNPENVHLREQLASFYVRQGEYNRALDIFQKSLAPPSNDLVWLDAIFWQKITRPLDFDWKSTPHPQGKLEPLVQYLLQLQPGSFWDANKYRLVANGDFFLKTQQETFWLRLLQFLKDGKEKEAYKLLKYNPFRTTCWYPEIAETLQRILNYRQSGSLAMETVITGLEGHQNDQKMRLQLPPFFQELEAASQEPGKDLSPELRQLLMSPEIFSAIFIAANWDEAGLSLHKLSVIPDDLPNWIAYNLTQAISRNRGLIEALEFASVQKQSPDLILLRGELTITGGDNDGALKLLETIAKEPSVGGVRAAWLSSLIYIEKKDWKNAKQALIANPQLIQETLGKETLARIAHLEGDATSAYKLYASIQKESSEARSYLAKKAYQDRDWNKARVLTELLIKEFPENETLKHNLERIIEEQKKRGSI